MPLVTCEEKDAFFLDVEAAAKKAAWCAVATVENNEPRVRMVHPTWDGDLLWIATAPQSPKARRLQNNAAIRVQPLRVELSELFGTMNKRVWKP
ncbi:MAG: putative pyridoxamine 5'-phosphate oxidase family protein [Halieaceae bacterium]|jgi:uncharacterized pyridoxamine 5'-phosphate oxidase family protein